MAHVLSSPPFTKVKHENANTSLASSQDSASNSHKRRKTNTHGRHARLRHLSRETSNWKPLATRVLIVTFLVALTAVALRRCVLRRRSPSMSTVLQDSDTALPRGTFDDRARFRVVDEGGGEEKSAVPSSPVEGEAAAVAPLTRVSTMAETDERPRTGERVGAELKAEGPPKRSEGLDKLLKNVKVEIERQHRLLNTAILEGDTKAITSANERLFSLLKGQAVLQRYLDKSGKGGSAS
ncbi:UNVERIFIED_CONTAM: hypothetical protein HHA_214400 [Hammondia hammondi]|eukprot:XP_008885360.1 hypothetical protein HHA_214400 [Hammondia hammondi]